MTCEDVIKELDLNVSCCVSCHEDADEYNYDLCTYRFPDGREAEVCCHVADAAERLKPC